MFKETDELTGFLGSETKIDGNLITKKLLRFDGFLKGKIYSNDSVIIGASAKIIGEIYCRNLKFDGELEGDIYCLERAELKENSRVNGNIFSEKLELHDHGFVNGKVFVGKFARKKLEEKFESIKKELGIEK